MGGRSALWHGQEDAALDPERGGERGCSQARSDEEPVVACSVCSRACVGWLERRLAAAEDAYVHHRSVPGGDNGGREGSRREASQDNSRMHLMVLTFTGGPQLCTTSACTVRRPRLLCQHACTAPRPA